MICGQTIGNKESVLTLHVAEDFEAKSSRPSMNITLCSFVVILPIVPKMRSARALLVFAPDRAISDKDLPLCDVVLIVVVYAGVAQLFSKKVLDHDDLVLELDLAVIEAEHELTICDLDTMDSVTRIVVYTAIGRVSIRLRSLLVVSVL